ncbi:hypothetical protein [Aliterella atlantica]|uniref:Uncharacterized protein n=1 Tax=Aliterella atlantica CENA595 TaxID=1618023 RepID=A0A0D8ZPG1_9CYAN|nr:hypothetical protein [Aliterella atlantica]KJH70683.1 hypothetical protein UH38_16625 [Aliterella atlantica CENA595]
MLINWIYEENLKLLLETLSCLVDYSFDESDWVAFNIGIVNTNVEKDEWYEYQLIGKQTIEVKIAADPGSCVIHVQLQSKPDVEEKAEVAITIFSNTKWCKSSQPQRKKARKMT